MKIALVKNSYIKKYNIYEFETLLQHKAFMDASRKNTNYTLRNIFLVNKLQVFQIYETLPQHKAFMGMSRKCTNYTLRNIQL